MSEALELHDVARALARAARRTLALGVLGAVGGLGFALAVPPRFDAELMLLVRTPPDASSAIAERLGPLAGLAGGALGSGRSPTQLETEIALLRSRSLIGDVVDSLGLQRQVARRAPTALPPLALPQGRFRPRRVTLGGVRLRVVDREDAIDDALERFDVRELGGEVLALRFRARDSVTAAAFPNLVAARYLSRRTTVDRGLNQRDFEFAAAKADSSRRALRQALSELRRLQQTEELLDVQVVGRAEAEQTAKLQADLAGVQGELLALDSLLVVVRTGGDVRVLAGFPAFLASPAVNELVAEMSSLQTERARLLAEQRDTAPTVRAVAAARDSLAAQLIPLATTYAGSLERQQASLLSALSARRQARGQLAEAGERIYYAQTEVGRMAQAVLALETRVLESRLAAAKEGGDVRVVDPAAVPRTVAFPKRLVAMVVGTLVGLALGVLWALAPLARRPDGVLPSG